MLLTLLPKELYFRNCSRLTDYTANMVYNLLDLAFAKVENNPFNFKFSELEAFNNAVLLCTMVLHDDDMPSVHYKEYDNYARSLYKQTTYPVNLTMWLVYGLLSLVTSEADRLKPLLLRIERHHYLLNDPYYAYTSAYRQAIYEFIEEARGQHLQLTREDFPLTLLSTAEEWKWSNIEWKECTEDFETDTIDGILGLWTKKNDKLFVLSEIRKAFEEEEERIRQQQEQENELPF